MKLSEFFGTKIPNYSIEYFIEVHCDRILRQNTNNFINIIQIYLN